MQRRVKSVLARIFAATALTGCVTINIYFPAAAAERVADRIIDEVWELKPDAAKSSTTKPPAAKPATPQ